MYLLDDWGMGEAQLLNQHNVNQYHLSVEHDDDEVSLLPLNSQVRIFSFLYNGSSRPKDLGLSEQFCETRPSFRMLTNFIEDEPVGQDKAIRFVFISIDIINKFHFIIRFVF